MTRSVGRRGRGGGRSSGRRRTKRVEPTEQCPNPRCHNTDPAYIGDLWESAYDTAPENIKQRIKEHLWGAKRCLYCGVVFLEHQFRRSQRIAYFEPPAHVMGGQLEGWHPYPPDLTPPSD
jgi:hypothetical protein